MTRGALLYEGKAKKVFETSGHPEQMWLEFKDSLTAFNALKKGSFPDKGAINRDIASLIFRYLERQKIATHYLADEGENGMRTRKLEMIMLEVVVRNKLAGSTAKKLGKAEGTALAQPLVEFYYKDDALADPFISDEQALMLNVATQTELNELKRLAKLTNEHLKHLFSEVGIELIDFKLEYGRIPGAKELILGDEISPDSCRLWDLKTQEKLDKDRFRRDLGQVDESYREVLRRLKTRWENEQ